MAGSIRSRRVIEVLTKLVSVRGAPKHLRSDNGPEFISKAVLKWLVDSEIETALIDPGKPWQNGANENFNGKFRDECLGMQWFKNRIDAKVVIEDWRRSNNEVRPHSSLQNLTPTECARTLSESGHKGAVRSEGLARRNQAGHSRWPSWRPTSSRASSPGGSPSSSPRTGSSSRSICRCVGRNNGRCWGSTSRADLRTGAGVRRAPRERQRIRRESEPLDYPVETNAVTAGSNREIRASPVRSAEPDPPRTKRPHGFFLRLANECADRLYVERPDGGAGGYRTPSTSRRRESDAGADRARRRLVRHLAPRASTFG